MMTWEKEDVFEYFLQHKQYYQKIYRKGKSAAIAANFDEEDQLAIEVRESIVEIAPEATATFIAKDPEPSMENFESGEELSRRKKNKKVVSNNLVVPYFHSFRPFDYITICQVLIEVPSPNDVSKHLPAWIGKQKKNGNPYPKTRI
jgi:hypothetical protein